MYLLLLLLLFSAIPRTVHSQDLQVYYADQENGKIYRSHLDGTNKEVLFDGFHYGPEDVVIDEVTGKIYWSQEFSGSDGFRPNGGIWRSNRDGSDIEELVRGLWGPKDITLDGNGKMYWRETLSFNKVIKRSNIDGTDVQELAVGDREIKAMAVDPLEEHIYWVTESQLIRAHLDGTGVDTVLTEILFFHPTDIAIDPIAEKVYAVGSSRSVIRTINFDATDVQDVVSRPGSAILDITLDVTSGHLYWLEEKDDLYEVYRSNLDGTDGTSLLTDEEKLLGVGVDAAEELLVLGEGNAMSTATIDGMDRTIIVLPNDIESLKLDLEAEKMYWIDLGHLAIRRANLDGTDVEDVLSVEDATGLLLDPEGERIYWKNYSTGTIHRADYGGASSEVIVELESQYALGGFTVEPTEGKIYWTDRDEDVIYRANLDGTEPTLYFEPEDAPGLEIYSYVDVDPETKRIYWLETRYGKQLSVMRADLEGERNQVVVDTRGFKQGFHDIRLSADGQYMYIIRYQVNPPIFFESLVAHYVKYEPVTPEPFYDLSFVSPERITSVDFDWRHIEPPVVDVVENFTLIDAETDEPVAFHHPIKEGGVINLEHFYRGVNIRANTTGGDVESVAFEFKGQSPFRIESYPPYALFGDTNGDYLDGEGEFGVGGVYTITAKAYSEDNAGGTLLGSKTLTVTVHNGVGVNALYLVDPALDRDIMVLEDGAALNLDDLPTILTVRADVLSKTRFVRFEMVPDGYVHTETTWPYALFGDTNGDFVGRPISEGEHTLTAIGYEGPNFGDFNGPPYTVTFTAFRGSAPGEAYRMDEPMKPDALPDTYALDSNYPNPFNPVTTIAYQLPGASHVRLVVYDLYGREVGMLVDEQQSAGRYDVSFDASGLASGTYVYRLEAGPYTDTKLMVLVK